MPNAGSGEEHATPPFTISAGELRQVTDAMAAAVRLQS
jgi:hypothetical protein